MFKPNKHEEEQKKTQTKKKNVIIVYLINDKVEKMKEVTFGRAKEQKERQKKRNKVC